MLPAPVLGPHQGHADQDPGLHEAARRHRWVTLVITGDESSSPVSGVVEAGLVTNTYCYPQAQIIQNFFSIDETELSYKNYNVKRIPLIQCRVRQLLCA